MNNVTLAYNPYLPELKAYINGRPLSRYSSIMAYKNAPFVDWCDRFFSDIHKEVNDAYDLLFVGTEFEAEIMESFSEKEPYCKSFSVREPKLNRSVFDRLATLEKLTADSKSLLKVRLFSEDDSLVQAMFEVLDENGIFVCASDEHATCDDCPMVSIELSSFSLSRLVDNNDASMNLFVTTQDPDEDFIDKYDSEVPIFVFCIGAKSYFKDKRGNIFVYSIDADNISDYLLRIIAGYKLCEFLSEKSYEAQKSFESATIPLTDSEYEELEQVCLIEPIYKARLPTEIYRGRSFDCRVKEYPEISDHQYRLETDVADVIQIEGLHIKAVGGGIAEIRVFKVDEPEPIAVGQVKVLDVALIDRIEIFPSYKSIGVSMEDTVEVTVHPNNAVNMQEVKWSTSDPSIARITGANSIMGVSCGSCDLIVCAGDVRSSAQIEVMPLLEDILTPSNAVNIRAGEQLEWKYSLKPENCYERDIIKVWSSDDNVASYLGGYIIAKKPGIANISVYTHDNRIKKNCHVTVNRKNFFR